MKLVNLFLSLLGRVGVALIFKNLTFKFIVGTFQRVGPHHLPFLLESAFPRIFCCFSLSFFLNISIFLNKIFSNYRIIIIKKNLIIIILFEIQRLDAQTSCEHQVSLDPTTRKLQRLDIWGKIIIGSLYFLKFFL